jgi:hypothetical protein
MEKVNYDDLFHTITSMTESEIAAGRVSKDNYEETITDIANSVFADYSQYIVHLMHISGSECNIYLQTVTQEDLGGSVADIFIRATLRQLTSNSIFYIRSTYFSK